MNVSPAWKAAYDADPKAMQDGWRAILGQKFTFPREVMLAIPGPEGKRYNETAYTMQEYYRLVEQNAPRRDLWVSWSNSTEYDTQAMSWTYGDVDSNADLQDALTRARRYEEFCMATFDVQPVAMFSCGKGFHLHFTHDVVPYKGKPYSDALLYLSDKSRAYLDAGPLKHRNAKPRIPYSINLKATGREQAAMFVVPVDLSWDLGDIMRAAKQCLVSPFRVPHSHEAAKAILPLAEKTSRRLEALAASRKGKDSGAAEATINAALEFCHDNGPRMVDGRGRPDGRKRLMTAVLIPALLHRHKGHVGMTLDDAKAWTELVGADWRTYGPAAKGAVEYCTKTEGLLIQPMGIVRWLSEQPGLRFTGAV